MLEEPSLDAAFAIPYPVAQPPLPPPTFQNENVVVCGDMHCTFYRLEGVNLLRRAASLGTKGKIQKMQCIGWCGADAVIGTGSGKLYRFLDNVLQQVRVRGVTPRARTKHHHLGGD